MTSSTRSGGSRSPASQEGTGFIGTVVGVTILMVLLLFAVQVLFGLYTTSVVTAVTYDAARTVAGAGHGDSAAIQESAVSRARRQLGGAGDRADFRWDNDVDTIRLTVRARRPTLLPPSLAAGMGLGDIERTVRLRVERVR